MTPGRNDPCPCGSGKKYKHCCLKGAPDKLNVIVKSTDGPLVHGYLKQISYAMVPVTAQQAADNDGPHPAGYPGTYAVEFTLQPPARTLMADSLVETKSDLPGDSLLQIVKPGPGKANQPRAIKVEVVSNDQAHSRAMLRYLFLPNENGFLSTIKTQLYALDSITAERIAYRNLLPILTEWAFIYDVPLNIVRTRIEESATKTVRVVYTSQAYQRIELKADQRSGFAQVPGGYHPLVFYHEALSATSPIYQFLCFFKAIELVGGIRTQKVKVAKQNAQKPSVVTERLVVDRWLQSHVDATLLSQISGKTFGEIRETALRPMRNRLAHAFLEDEEPASQPPAELLDVSEVYKLLPVAKYLAHRMTANEMNIVIEREG